MLQLRLIMVLLLVICFSLATALQPRQFHLEQSDSRSDGFLALVFGDGRKLFAKQVFAKADAYFHRGKYPSIFDLSAREKENHMSDASQQEKSSGAAGHEEPEDHDHQQNEEKMPPTRDWIEHFGEKFRPAVHTHLENGRENEMLPWLKLSAELDPQSVETYTVAAYWLRERLGKVDEAERFLREGLQKNPDSPDLLNELARLYYENRKDLNRARNLWKVALRRWHEVEAHKKHPNGLLAERILIGLFFVERDENHYAEAIGYLKLLKEMSPMPEAIQKRIDELNAKVQSSPLL